MLKVVLLLFVIILAITPARCQSLSAKEQQRIIGEIRQTFDNYVRDVKAAGLSAEFRYLDSSADFFWVPPGYQTAVSFDSIATVLKQTAPKLRTVDNSYDSLRIIPLTRRHAAYTAIVTSITTDTSGITTKVSLVETGVLIKRKNGWKLLNGQTGILH
jgi:hypothetical protein